jgi:phospholipid/cholesterol/gamma-HCH transport system substrate-binding protein
MESKTVQVAVGVFIVAGLAALFMLAMKVSNLSTFSTQDGYALTARFDNVGGLKVRAPVTMAGVRIGRVTSISFDQKTYEAVVKLEIEPKFNQIPDDSSASILTSGLLGEQYVGLQPGAEDKYFQAGGQIKYTQSALVLERLVSQFLFNKAEGGDAKK